MARQSSASSAALNQVEAPLLGSESSRRTGRLVFLPPDWLPLALLAGDALIVVGSIAAAYWYYHNLDPLRRTEGLALPFGPYIPAMPVVVAIYLASLAINQQYKSWRGRTVMDLLLGLYSGIGLAAVLVLAAISVTNLGVHYSRLTITYMVVLTAVLMTGERYLLRQCETRLRRKGIGAERVLIVGTGPGAEMLVRRMSMFPQYGFQVCGVLDDELGRGTSFAGIPVVGGVDELPVQARALAADQVFIAMATQNRGRLVHLIKLCEDQELEFKVIPDLLDIMSTRTEVNSIDGLPIVGVRHSRLTGGKAGLKRPLDIAINAGALVILAIPLLVFALLLKITSPRGPVIFQQGRIGVGPAPFNVLRFPTLV